MRSLSLSALTLSSSLLLMLMLLLLLNTKRCRASISQPEMDGDLPLYSIADHSNLDSEFMMDSEINRILSASAAAAAAAAGNQGLDPSTILFKLRDSIRYGLEKKNNIRCRLYNRVDPCFRDRA
ncbi:hypothetical protein OIU74_027811 [Salix koriyanagi]|uniref:Uncharacterized protein n=1 Tax=Salix koriyanagi TaxID=2511006 RepID=A0A9Q0VQC0_9ROSI|nr:hypothetical protein OIU74_027811 [Salix koriyanagi]